MYKRIYRILLAVLVLGLSVQQVHGQELPRNVFHGSPKVRGGLAAGLAYAMAGAAIIPFGEDALENPVLRWLLPSSELDFHIPGWSLTQNGVDVPLEAPDWWSIIYPDFVHDYNYSFGYEVSWKSLVIPLGAYAGFDFEWRQVCVSKGLLAGKHRTTAFIPSAGVRVRLLGNGFERVNNWNIVIDCGAAYNYALKYRNFFGWDTDAIGNGWRPRLGLIVSTIDHGAFYIRWEQDKYGFFNNEYTLPDGSKPFAAMQNNFNSIIIGWSLFI